jgi:hypothetical protein
MPQTFSPTVKPPTFAFMMQIVIKLDCIWCTADIKSAYLNVPRPSGAIPILTKLEPFVADIYDLHIQQLYRIDKCLYGLPDSERLFYRHYRDALIAEGYVMSKMDNCLFYRINDVATTFIVLFVDDTLLFSKRQEDIDRLNRHYERTLNAKAGESTSNIAMMGQSCLPSQSYYRSCSKNTQIRSVSARPGRRHTRTDLRRHTMPQLSRINHRSYQ